MKRAKSRSIAEIINSGIQPYQNPSTQRQIANWFGEEKKKEWLYFYIHKGFRVLEEALKEHGGKYSVSDSVSLADLFLVPQVYASTRFGVDVKQYKTVIRVTDELGKISAFKKAHPYRQIDTPEELRIKQI